MAGNLIEYKNKPYLSTSETAAILGVSVSTIQGLVESGVLLAWKTRGGHRRIPQDSISAILKHNKPLDMGYKLTSEKPVASAADPARNKLDIMIVEDDPFIAQIYQGALSKFAPLFDLRTCSDGITALLEIGKQLPDFIILDIDIPNVNGLEMLKSLQSNAARKAIQVLVITGVDQETLEEHQPLLHHYAVAEKPINTDFLFGYLTCLFSAR